MTPIGSMPGAKPIATSRIGLAASPETAVEPTCSTATASSPQGGAQLGRQPLERRRPAGVAGDQPDLAVGQAEVSAAEPVANA